MKFSRALTGMCLITLFLLVSSQDADAAKKAKKVKADDTVTNKVREEKKEREEEKNDRDVCFFNASFLSFLGS